jgi:trimeric autotransporter adhesin
LPSDKKFAVSANLGAFRGQSAFGGSAQVRISDNLVLNAGIGAGFREGGVGGRVGATLAW